VTATIDAIDTAINDLAEMRAQNGAEQTMLTHASDLLKINQINLEAANSRIMDLDIANESSNLARLNIMQQAGMAMLAQANQSQDAVLRLLY
jgi:flagellin